MNKKKTNAVAFEETVMLDATTSLRELGDGYVVCSPRIARTGIQVYQGYEIGRPDLKEVRVYRPESEVFSKDAIKTLAGKPVTIEHPSEPVTAKTWRSVAVGHVGEEVMRDGEFIRVPLILMDSSAIDEVRKGRSQLSVGYSATLLWQDGVTPEGEAFDVKQTAIRANHVAITHTARGGPKLRMGDRNSGVKQMSKTIMIDGIPVELEERDGTLIERTISKLKSDLATAQTELATAKTTTQNDVATAKTETANATAAIATKDAELATLKQQLADSKLTPQKLDQMVAERTQTMLRAKALVGDSLVVEGKTDADMRRQVVAAKLGEVAKDWTDDQVMASFNTLTVSVGDSNNGNLHQVVNVIRHNETLVGGDPVAKAYSDYDAALSNRWKTAGVRQPNA
jgi:uncharacterized protein